MENALRRPDRIRFAAGFIVVLLSLWSRLPVAAATPAFEIVPIKGWRYTTSAPADGWTHAEFSDASWQAGAPGFGNDALPALQQSLVKTPWTTADIWVRGVFELDRVSDLPALRLSHDDDVEVFVNGVLAFAQKGFITDYEIHLLNERASQALHSGKNAIAAHCHQIAGGQFLDVQVIKRIPPARRSPESIIQELGPVPRPEHPRPDRLRPQWLNLNGVWEFAFDPNDFGLKEAWNDGRRLEKRIVVPFCPESVMSGVGDEGFHSICWYARNFDLPKNLRKQRLLLHFGAVDYQADVYLNGRYLGRHEGGYDSFEFDVSAAVKPKNNRLVLRAYDDPQQAKPRGKQSPERFPSGCAYMRVSGIWQTVWLEAVGPTFVNEWTLAADPDTGLLRVRATTDGSHQKLRLFAVVSQEGRDIASSAASVQESKTELLVSVPHPTPWSPDNPALYDLRFVLESDGKEIDRVSTYFGFRKIETREGMYRLNGKPFFLISALDQGYHPLSLYTPKTDDEQRQDVEWAKRYGLNGIRKHQIVAEPRFHYWCDRLGLTEWGEMADSGASLDPLDQYLREWTACVKRDINHPCIITWVPTNERRPVDDQAIAEKVGVYEATKRLDPTRPVIDTSGYCHTKTDITDLHVNPRNGADCRKWWERWRKSISETGNFPAYPDRPTFCKGFRHQGQPVIFSETGNWRITELPPMGFWTPCGYGPVPTINAYINLYRDFFLALMTEPECAGFSYVQLYDVEGEVNGYLTYDRKPKVAPEIIAGIHAEGLRRRNEMSKPEASPR